MKFTSSVTTASILRVLAVFSFVQMGLLPICRGGSILNNSVAPPAEAKFWDEDLEISQKIVKAYSACTEQAGLKLEGEASVVQGLSDYLQDRRSRKLPFTKEDLHVLIFSHSWLTDREECESVEPSPEWLESFGVDSAAPNSHFALLTSLEGAGKIPPLLETTNLPSQGGKKGTRSLVKRIQFGANDVYFKRPSPLLVNPHSESAYIRVLSEVVSSRINQLLGLSVVEKTDFAKDGEFFGSTRTTIRVDQKKFQYDRPPGLKDSDLENDQSPWLTGISHLRTMDFILGGYDRHEGNMLYDPTNFKLQGIDYEEDLTGVPASNKKFLISGGRFPSFYDSDLKKSLLGITYEMLQASVSDVALEEEIENLWLRIMILQADATLKDT